jgi:hypothetical protein
MNRDGATVTIIFETHATSRDNERGLASGWFDVDFDGFPSSPTLLPSERGEGSLVRDVMPPQRQSLQEDIFAVDPPLPTPTGRVPSGRRGRGVRVYQIDPIRQIDIVFTLPSPKIRRPWLSGREG